jgi:hypothetical protein
MNYTNYKSSHDFCVILSAIFKIVQKCKRTYNIVKDVGHEVLVMGTRLPERLLFDKSKTLSLGIFEMEARIDSLS